MEETFGAHDIVRVIAFGLLDGFADIREGGEIDNHLRASFAQGGADHLTGRRKTTACDFPFHKFLSVRAQENDVVAILTPLFILNIADPLGDSS